MLLRKLVLSVDGVPRAIQSPSSHFCIEGLVRLQLEPKTSRLDS